VERLLTTLASHRELCRGIEPHYALCFEGRLSAELMRAKAPVHWLGKVRISHPLTVVRARRRLGELVQQHSFGLVICHSAWSHSLFAPTARAANIPLAFWLHSATKGTHWLERWARRTRPDLVLCNSKFTAKSLPKMYPDVRSEVIYCPVATPADMNTAADRAAKRAELQTPENAVVIIQVSRMESWKGQDLHLKALSLLKDLPGWVCWQVGGAQRPAELEYLKHLKGLAGRLGIGNRVHFLGQRSDVAGLLAAADVYCQPNTEPEPFGISFIEALLAQLPVVSTNIGGASEILKKSLGELVPPGDPQALAGALRRLIEDRGLRAHLGANGPHRARELCDPTTQIEHLGRLLVSVAPLAA